MSASAPTTTAALEAIDLSTAEKHECPGVVTRDQDRDAWYLAYVFDEFMVGRFSRQWYGLHFDCDWGASGIQFDAPGSNSSCWLALWRICADEGLIAEGRRHRSRQQELIRKAREEDEDDDA